MCIDFLQGYHLPIYGGYEKTLIEITVNVVLNEDMKKR